MSRWFARMAAGILLVSGFAGAGRASTIIDPVMRVLDDEFSNAILQGTNFFPNGGGGGVFGFFNSGNTNITEITFQVGIAPNLDQATIAANFVCNQGNFNPFFQFCGISYTPTSGILSLAFWGTGAATNPAGVWQGIAPLPSGCLATPDAAGCGTSGHFAISLAGQDLLTAPPITAADQSGGWSFDSNPVLFTPGGPTFTVTQLQTALGAQPDFLPTPEPGTIGLLALGLGGLTWLSARRRSGATAAGPESRS